MNTSTTFSATDGADYELVMGRWSRRLAPAFADFAGVCDGEQVLDVGCGTGQLASVLAARAPRANIAAIDISPAYIDHARRANPFPRVSYALGDACALTFATGSMDRVLSLLVLHFMPDPAQAIAEMRRVARPGAVLAACVWDVRGGFVASRMFYDTAAALDPRAIAYRARNFTRPMTRPGELGSAWRNGGLLDVQETSLSTRMEFASFDDYWAPYERREGPASAYLDQLSPVEKARLIDALRSAYLDGEPDGPRSYAALAWAVKGITPGPEPMPASR